MPACWAVVVEAAMGARTAAAVAAKARIRGSAEARILEAAAEVFSRKGRSATTIAEIAERAAMPTATVHYYYGSKGALYDAVLGQVLALWTRELDQLDAHASPAAALAAYIEAKMRVSFAHPAASRIVAGEVLQGGERLKSFLAEEFAPRLRQRLAQIEGWQEARLLRPLDPFHLFLAIWAATEFYANFAAEIVALRGPDALSPARQSAVTMSVVDLFLNGILPRMA